MIMSISLQQAERPAASSQRPADDDDVDITPVDDDNVEIMSARFSNGADIPDLHSGA